MAPEQSPSSAPGTRLLRPKGQLEKLELGLLLSLAMLPLLVILVRILALPGVAGSGLQSLVPDLLHTLGNDLNQQLSLLAVRPSDRERVLHLLFIPSYALLILIARLTLGLRLLGFRSILIAVGFQESGVVPSLILIAVVVAITVAVRPALRSIRLPFYPRVSVILGLVVVTMVGALLAGPWLRSETLWNAAFFPVVVLGLLAEGIARTLDQSSGLNAAWRAGTTIAVAFLIAMLSRIPLLQEVLLQFPELLVTQIAAIVLISEFLDLRLFQDLDARFSGVALPRLFSSQGAYRVALVQNRRNAGIIGRLGRPSPTRYGRRPVQQVAAALREASHSVKVVEGDSSLLPELRAFIPTHPVSGEPGGLAFNLSHGIQGHAASAHVPAMLEMAGIAYTGPTPLALAIASDRVALRTLLQQAGVPGPGFRVVADPGAALDLPYPALVCSRHESDFAPRRVRDRRQLRAALSAVVHEHGQEAVVEEIVPGREIHVALLGNDPAECLPLVAIGSGEQTPRCPAALEPALARRVRECAEAAFRACQARDYARIRVCVGDAGELHVLGVDFLGILKADSSFALAAAAAGYGFGELACRIVELARARYRPGAAVTSPQLGKAPAQARAEEDAVFAR